MITLQYQVPSISYKQARPPSSKSNASMSPSNSNPSSRRFDPEPTYSKQSELAICLLNHGRNRPLKSLYDLQPPVGASDGLFRSGILNLGAAVPFLRAGNYPKIPGLRFARDNQASSEIVPGSDKLRGPLGAFFRSAVMIFGSAAFHLQGDCCVKMRSTRSTSGKRKSQGTRLRTLVGVQYGMSMPRDENLFQALSSAVAHAVPLHRVRFEVFRACVFDLHTIRRIDLIQSLALRVLGGLHGVDRFKSLPLAGRAIFTPVSACAFVLSLLRSARKHCEASQAAVLPSLSVAARIC